MKGISDLLEADIEMGDSPDAIDENSILSSASETANTNATKKQPKKRHRVTMPKSKAKINKASPEPKKRVPKKATVAKRKALEERVNEQIERDEEDDNKEDEPGQVRAIAKSRAKAPSKAKAFASAPASEHDTEVEVEQTPMEARSSHAPVAKAREIRKVVKKATVTKRPVTSTVQAHALVDESENEFATIDQSVLQQPPVPRSRNNSRMRYETGARRRAGSASDTERGDPNLRRKLGDITRKFENVDLKYRNLREVGIVEASANAEKMKKQCDVMTQASNELIGSLKKELTVQAPLVQESRKLKKDLQMRDTETSGLRIQVSDLSASLNSAQNEIKALQAKLAAARTATESLSTKTPGSTIKNNAVARPIVMSNAEATQAAQIAQMKEDLYSDLTGLIIRSVRRTEEGDLYDCIQTGRNGTLHFKLYVDQEDAKSASFEDTEFLYTPLLDANRDRDMVELMPTYLTEEITFARQNAAKFYGRVVDTLTKRRTEE